MQKMKNTRVIKSYSFDSRIKSLASSCNLLISKLKFLFNVQYSNVIKSTFAGKRAKNKGNCYREFFDIFKNKN